MNLGPQCIHWPPRMESSNIHAVLTRSRTNINCSYWRDVKHPRAAVFTRPSTPRPTDVTGFASRACSSIFLSHISLDVCRLVGAKSSPEKFASCSDLVPRSISPHSRSHFCEFLPQRELTTVALFSLVDVRKLIRVMMHVKRKQKKLRE